MHTVDRPSLLGHARTLLCASLLFAGAASAQTFTGTGTGAIPDSGGGTCPTAGGAPLVVSFAVSGVAAPLTNVSLSISASHTWIGDVVATLRAPGGTPSFVIFGGVGLTAATGAGFSSNMATGPYVFQNGGTNWWTVHSATSANNAPAGTYCTTPLGGAGVTNPPACTDLTAAFAGLSSAQVNGTWTLNVIDRCALDTGSVTAAALTLAGAAAAPLTSTPASGATIVLGPQALGAGPATQVLQFTNPNASAATVNCTAPAATQFTVNPLVINVPANGSASTTISYTSAAVGNFVGQLSCNAGAQAFTYTLNGSTTGGVVGIDTLGPWGKLVMLLAVLGIGLVAVRRH